MKKFEVFSDKLNFFMNRAGISPGRLSDLTARIFRPNGRVSKSTIVNWSTGRVDKPRNWPALVKIVVALRMTETEANALFIFAGYAAMHEMVDDTEDEKIKEYLEHWDELIFGPELEPIYESSLRKGRTSNVGFNELFSNRLWSISAKVVGILLVFVIVWRLGFINLFSKASLANDDAPAPTVKITLAPTEVATMEIVEYISLCGESALKEDSATEPRFIASQGVSSFTKENTTVGILNNRIRAITPAPNGLLIGYFRDEENSTNGLTYLDNRNSRAKNWANCNDGGDTTEKRINSIVVDQDGGIWMSTDGGGVLHFENGIWQIFTETKNRIPINSTFELTIDDNGDIWLGTLEGVAKFVDDDWEIIYDIKGELPANQVFSVEFDSLGNIWVGHISDGVSQFRASDGKWVFHRFEDGGIGGNQVRRIVIQRGGKNSSESIWFATEDGGISKYENDEWEVFGIEDGLPSNHIRAIAVDSVNRIWVGTDKGTAFLNGEEWVQYHSFSTLSIAFTPGCQDTPCAEDDFVWTGTEENGLTNSRLPYQSKPIIVTRICFETPDRELFCPEFVETLSPHIITVEYPEVLLPGEKFYFRIEVIPQDGFELRSDRGDFLSFTGEDPINLFGSHFLVPVEGVVVSGQYYEFSNKEFMFTVPDLPIDEDELTFTTTWRIWMFTRYAGSEIIITFVVAKVID